MLLSEPEPLIMERSEENSVTFQIAMIGCDGLVVGSDRLGRAIPSPSDPAMARRVEREPLPRFTQMKKFYVNADESVVCFAAGTQVALDAASAISESVKAGGIGTQWDSTIRGAILPLAVNSFGRGGKEEVIVVRRNTASLFWWVVLEHGKLRIIEMDGCWCTGTSSVAEFLPRHLWDKRQSTSTLRALAILTLAHAAEEEPSFV